MDQKVIMKPEDVAQYLLDNQQFFDEYAEILADIRIPHPYADRVVSLSEWQIVSLRKKNRQLQDKLHELINIAENNDAIVDKMHSLTIALLACNSLDETLIGLNAHLREDFTIAHVALRLWFSRDSDGEAQRPEFAPVSAAVHTTVESMAKPYCGPLLTDEIKQWFGQDAKQLQSFSMVPLQRKHAIGLLVMGSPTAERFYPAMGTLYLERLGELIAAALCRFERSDTEAVVHELPRS